MINETIYVAFNEWLTHKIEEKSSARQSIAIKSAFSLDRYCLPTPTYCLLYSTSLTRFSYFFFLFALSFTTSNRSYAHNECVWKRARAMAADNSREWAENRIHCVLRMGDNESATRCNNAHYVSSSMELFCGVDPGKRLLNRRMNTQNAITTHSRCIANSIHSSSIGVHLH